MIVSHKHKFIFFKTRKTAGSSLQVALAEHCGPDDIITGQYRLGVDDNSHSAGLNMEKFFTTHPHPELADVRRFLGEEIWNSYFKFGFVRNPFDIAVSRYHWDMKGKMGIQETSVEGFREWVKQGGLFDKDRAHLYISNGKAVELDFIGYYENLEEDVKYIYQKIGVPSLDLPTLKGGFRDNSSYISFYDQTTTQLVEEFFSDDFKLLQYNFENRNVIKRSNIITDKHFSDENDNIGTPCILKVKDTYHLYFSNHSGTSIKLATGPTLQGPWHVESVLHLKDTPCSTHIASPEVLLEDGIFKMYYHGDTKQGQGTFLAVSQDGKNFTNTTPEMLCHFYLRTFEYKGIRYGVAKKNNDGAIIYNVSNNFEPLFGFLPQARHCHGLVKEDTLYLVYSNVDSTPEHIRLCTIKLSEDVNDWEVLSDQALILPTFKHEGGNLEQVTSAAGSATLRFGRPVMELRDPFLFEIDDKVHILYVTQGERAIAYAQLTNFFR